MFGETTNSHVKFSVIIHNDTIEPVEDVADKIDNEISVRVDQMGELNMIKIGPFDSTARVATPPDLSDKKDHHSINISKNNGICIVSREWQPLLSVLVEKCVE